MIRLDPGCRSNAHTKYAQLGRPYKRVCAVTFCGGNLPPAKVMTSESQLRLECEATAMLS
ncbi:hypothetical protein JG687_00015419 [Phytophthora cactorum]|uniref:Uncharacterized protein n=1 Tax=Phytophthora cactorum TaxID=29920 RepID=A0A329RVL1_9STRA|nr:hypothetical protein Pcac1_g17798 [Phytophthora cactorum]KAG2798646.1 hypothetical protein PC112_g21257 [Phytophthora cactorum]KAG2798657.1 hypothetical protein PC111_g20758 [Phytophthora cactorum]KAG2829926.1 hypothetical protein PC113_g21198 [Phytophthora cactorum]KAG2877689.1 hypothetical protein PC114_g23506 [Phytophthora cactorum]